MLQDIIPLIYSLREKTAGNLMTQQSIEQETEDIMKVFRHLDQLYSAYDELPLVKQLKDELEQHIFSTDAAVKDITAVNNYLSIKGVDAIKTKFIAQLQAEVKELIRDAIVDDDEHAAAAGTEAAAPVAVTEDTAATRAKALLTTEFSIRRKKQKAGNGSNGGYFMSFNFDDLPEYEGLESILPPLRINPLDMIALTKLLKLDMAELFEHPLWEELVLLIYDSILPQASSTEESSQQHLIVLTLTERWVVGFQGNYQGMEVLLAIMQYFHKQWVTSSNHQTPRSIETLQNNDKEVEKDCYELTLFIKLCSSMKQYIDYTSNNKEIDLLLLYLWSLLTWGRINETKEFNLFEEIIMLESFNVDVLIEIINSCHPLILLTHCMTTGCIHYFISFFKRISISHSNKMKKLVGSMSLVFLAIISRVYNISTDLLDPCLDQLRGMNNVANTIRDGEKKEKCGQLQIILSTKKKNEFFQLLQSIDDTNKRFNHLNYDQINSIMKQSSKDNQQQEEEQQQQYHYELLYSCILNILQLVMSHCVTSHVITSSACSIMINILYYTFHLLNININNNSNDSNDNSSSSSNNDNNTKDNCIIQILSLCYNLLELIMKEILCSDKQQHQQQWFLLNHLLLGFEHFISNNIMILSSMKTLSTQCFHFITLFWKYSLSEEVMKKLRHITVMLLVVLPVTEVYVEERYKLVHHVVDQLMNMKQDRKVSMIEFINLSQCPWLSIYLFPYLEIIISTILMEPTHPQHGNINNSSNSTNSSTSSSNNMQSSCLHVLFGLCSLMKSSEIRNLFKHNIIPKLSNSNVDEEEESICLKLAVGVMTLGDDVIASQLLSFYLSKYHPIASTAAASSAASAATSTAAASSTALSEDNDIMYWLIIEIILFSFHHDDHDKNYLLLFDILQESNKNLLSQLLLTAMSHIKTCTNILHYAYRTKGSTVVDQIQTMMRSSITTIKTSHSEVMTLSLLIIKQFQFTCYHHHYHHDDHYHVERNDLYKKKEYIFMKPLLNKIQWYQRILIQQTIFNNYDDLIITLQQQLKQQLPPISISNTIKEDDNMIIKEDNIINIKNIMKMILRYDDINDSSIDHHYHHHHHHHYHDDSSIEWYHYLFYSLEMLKLSNHKVHMKYYLYIISLIKQYSVDIIKFDNGTNSIVTAMDDVIYGMIIKVVEILIHSSHGKVYGHMITMNKNLSLFIRFIFNSWFYGILSNNDIHIINLITILSNDLSFIIYTTAAICTKQIKNNCILNIESIIKPDLELGLYSLLPIMNDLAAETCHYEMKG